MQSEKSLRFEPWALSRLAGETDEKFARRRHAAYFKWQMEVGNPEFWRRLEKSQFSGKRVLDFGCGHGALTIDIARLGARKVIGCDLDEDRIRFATDLLRHSEFRDVIEFTAKNVGELDERDFDVVICKDSFEHIGDLHSVIKELDQRLAIGGLLMIGFGPLYYSPFGDHEEFLGKRRIPWLPAFVPEHTLITLRNWRTGQRVTSIAELGLNKLTAAEFRGLFPQPKWEFLSIKYNQGNKAFMSLMRALRRLKGLEHLFTVNIYATVRKTF